jgi:hypothetical protein
VAERIRNVMISSRKAAARIDAITGSKADAMVTPSLADAVDRGEQADECHDGRQRQTRDRDQF